MADDIFSPWFESIESDDGRLIVLNERTGGRREVIDDLVKVVADHLVDLRVIEKLGGFGRAAHVLKNRLPQSKKTRSGDLGEILATEYVDRHTRFRVPVRRLRYKDDRDTSMRGDDVLGFREAKSRVKVIKVEAKSRAKLTPSVISEARAGLAKHDGFPNPGTLAFLEYLLRKEDRDDEAELIKRLQSETINVRDVSHLVFTISGNNPTSQLQGAMDEVSEGISLSLRGCRVAQHGTFVQEIFDRCLGLGEPDGID